MSLYTYHIFRVAAVLFAIGLFGMLSRRNAISMLLSLELIINSAALSLVGASSFWSSWYDGYVLASFVIVIAAAEAAVAIGIFIALFSSKRSIDIDEVREMKG